MKFDRLFYARVAATALALAAAGTASLAQATSVYWSVGVQAGPGVTLGVGNHRPMVAAPYYPPVLVQPQPQPVFLQPQPVYVQPAPIYYSPPIPMYLAPAYPAGYRAAVVFGKQKFKKHKHWKRHHPEYVYSYRY